MEDFEKQILIFSVAVIIGVVIVISGASLWIHDKAIELISPVFFNYDDTGRAAESIGYAIELFLATIIMFTPLSAVASPWFLKIAFDLTLGRAADINVFLLHPALNAVMAIICVILFAYSLYNQYSWTVKLTQPLPGKEKDLARLI